MIRDYQDRDRSTCRALWAQLTQWHRDLYDDQSIGGDDPAGWFDRYLEEKEPVAVWVAELDLKVVAEKLNRLLGIKRITVQGGGTNNGSWLNSGLIDELSLVVMPFAEGKLGTPSVFDIAPKALRKRVHNLRLLSCKVYEKNCVWLRYRVVD